MGVIGIMELLFTCTFAPSSESSIGETMWEKKCYVTFAVQHQYYCDYLGFKPTIFWQTW